MTLVVREKHYKELSQKEEEKEGAEEVDRDGVTFKIPRSLAAKHSSSSSVSLLGAAESRRRFNQSP